MSGAFQLPVSELLRSAACQAGTLGELFCKRLRSSCLLPCFEVGHMLLVHFWKESMVVWGATISWNESLREGSAYQPPPSRFAVRRVWVCSSASSVPARIRPEPRLWEGTVGCMCLAEQVLQGFYGWIPRLFGQGLHSADFQECGNVYSWHVSGDQRKLLLLSLSGL